MAQSPTQYVQLFRTICATAHSMSMFVAHSMAKVPILCATFGHSMGQMAHSMSQIAHSMPQFAHTMCQFAHTMCECYIYYASNIAHTMVQFDTYYGPIVLRTFPPSGPRHSPACDQDILAELRRGKVDKRMILRQPAHRAHAVTTTTASPKDALCTVSSASLPDRKPSA